MVTDAFRLCPYCNRKQQVRYKGYNEQDILIFLSHFVSEVEGQRQLCIGSGEKFTKKAEPEPDAELESLIVPGTDTKSLPPPPPPAVVTVPTARVIPTVRPDQVPQGSAICSSCGKVIRMMKTARGVDLLIQHNNHHGQKCPKSLEPV